MSESNAAKDKLEANRVGKLPSVYLLPDFIDEIAEARLLSQVHSRGRWKQLSGRRLQEYGGTVHQKHGLLQAPLPSWMRALTERVASETGLWNGALPNHVLLNAYPPGSGIMSHQDGPLYDPCVCILSLGCPATMHFKRKQPLHQQQQQQPGPGSGFVSSPDQTLRSRQHSPESSCQPVQAAETGAESATHINPALSVLLMPRSLLIFRHSAYEECLHGIDEVVQDHFSHQEDDLTLYGLQAPCSLHRKSERVSLTIRRVPRVRRGLLRL
ncbi:hypothetical protein WJX74_005791 [Apatococcus lobatus]|uniref:Fe2OG dioxygenase domain-containing protein n=1 Tax=Apatococcus lobatus TaxID=904363 RepID=A0AAW1QCB8_9CHLO